MKPRCERYFAATVFCVLLTADVANAQDDTHQSAVPALGRFIYPASSIPQQISLNRSRASVRWDAGSVLKNVMDMISGLGFQQQASAPSNPATAKLNSLNPTGLVGQTNTIIFVPTQPSATGGPLTLMKHTPDDNIGFFNTPQSIACVYGLISKIPGCNPNDISLKSIELSGGSKTIAIVSAFDSPNAMVNFRAFSAAFHLRQSGLQIIYATGARPVAATGDNKGWATETDTDIEWAHAMAPDANILLVEAESNDVAALLYAAKVATDRVTAAGGGEVSMSWSADIDQLKQLYDFKDADIEAYEIEAFLQNGVVHLAASGDYPSVQYPASSSRVIAVGGTVLNRQATGAFDSESSWQCTGVGERLNRAQVPSYQAALVPPLKSRGVADLAAIADPSRGILVYVGKDDDGEQVDKGWSVYGGTSVATPILAGLINNAGHFYATSTAELSDLYKSIGSNRLTDIRAGQCGAMPAGALDCCDPKNNNEACCDPTNPNRSSQTCLAKTQHPRMYVAKQGWDYCTGIGSPNGLGGL